MEVVLCATARKDTKQQRDMRASNAKSGCGAVRCAAALFLVSQRKATRKKKRVVKNKKEETRDESIT